MSLVLLLSGRCLGVPGVPSDTISSSNDGIHKQCSMKFTNLNLNLKLMGLGESEGISTVYLMLPPERSHAGYSDVLINIMVMAISMGWVFLDPLKANSWDAELSQKILGQQCQDFSRWWLC